MILIATTTELRQFKMGFMKDIVPFSKEQEQLIKKNVELSGWFTDYQEIKVTEKEFPDGEKKNWL